MMDYLLHNGFDKKLVVEYLNTTIKSNFCIWQYELHNLQTDLEERYSGNKRYDIEVRDYNAFNLFLKSKKVNRPAGFQCDMVGPQLRNIQLSGSKSLCKSEKKYFLQFNIMVYYRFILWLETKYDDNSGKNNNTEIQNFYLYVKDIKNSYMHNKNDVLKILVEEHIENYFDDLPSQLRSHYDLFNTFFDYNYVAISEFAPVQLSEEEREERLGAKSVSIDGPINNLDLCDLYERL